MLCACPEGAQLRKQPQKEPANRSAATAGMGWGSARESYLLTDLSHSQGICLHPSSETHNEATHIRDMVAKLGQRLRVIVAPLGRGSAAYPHTADPSSRSSLAWAN